ISLKDGGDGEAGVRQGKLAFRFEAAVTADRGMAGMETRHEARAGRCADGGTGIALGEAHSVGGHAVDIGRMDLLLALVAYIAIAEIVGEDKDDIGTLCEGDVSGCQQQEKYADP